MSAFMELIHPKREMLAADMHHEVYQFKPHKHYRAVAEGRLAALATREPSASIAQRLSPKRSVMENGDDSSTPISCLTAALELILFRGSVRRSKQRIWR